jgi:hypothetical protein
MKATKTINQFIHANVYSNMLIKPKFAAGLLKSEGQKKDKLTK